ncbi:MAG: cation-transporting P-type ATPase [Actinomycetota bacterium]|nr:cation-transporting P-type ATPase [Actinomycetota bacterium]
MTAKTAPASGIGLTTSGASALRRAIGPNELPERRSPGLIRRAVTQLRHPLVLLLLAAAVTAIVILRDLKEGIAILAIVALDVVVGAAQEQRADRAIAALRALTAPTARVWRDGVVVTLPAADLVPGDAVEIAAGDRVPADMCLVDAQSLAVDEAILTGESLSVGKEIDADANAYAGTLVVRGHGRGVVAHTGPRSRLGRIAAGLTPPPTPPIQRELEQVGRTMAVLAIAVGVLLVPVAALRSTEHDAFVEAVLAGVALAVAAIPEGLPAAVTVALALGAQRMARKGAIVRRLAAIETLGCTTVLCTDKTGTLTTGRLALTATDALAGRQSDLWRAALMCNDALSGGSDPIDHAIVDGARVAGIPLPDAPRVHERPFDSENRYMATVHGGPGGPIVSMKGAPEAVLPRCVVSDEQREQLRLAVHDATSAGDRVLLVADARSDDLDADNLRPLGLLRFSDPMRDSAPAAVADCRRAGIRLVLVTGDHHGTAVTIAKAAGLDREPAVIGADMRALDPDDRRDALARASIVARVDPDLKVELVEVHRERGDVVAMTGDGVNDAPALRRADIGVAMAGDAGTDVAREAADLVVTNGDLGTIVGAVREGRRIYRNLSNLVAYLVTGNLSEIMVVAFGMLLLPELAVPLLPVHLLWVNLVTDGLPALALGVDDPPGDPLALPPRDPAQRLLGRRRVARLAVAALAIALPVLACGRYAYEQGWSPATQRTQLLLALVLAHLALAYVARAQRFTLERGALRNRALLVAVGGSIVVQLALMFFTSSRSWLELTPLPAAGWIAALAAVTCSVIVLDTARALERRFRRR